MVYIYIAHLRQYSDGYEHTFSVVKSFDFYAFIIKLLEEQRALSKMASKMP